MGTFRYPGERNWLKMSGMGRSSVIKYSLGVRLLLHNALFTQVVIVRYTYLENSSTGQDIFRL